MGWWGVINKVTTAILVNKNIYSHIDLNLFTDDLTVVAVKGIMDKPLLLAYCQRPSYKKPIVDNYRLILVIFYLY